MENTMRLHNWRRFLAAAAILVASSATASAQFTSATSAQPAPGPTALTVPATPPMSVVLPDQTAVAYKHNGKLATATRGFIMAGGGNYWHSACANGANCNNGAGSCAADIGFIFGSSNGFFHPCGPRLLPENGCGGGWGCAKCGTPIYGRGPCGPWARCTYDSYLNH
jgi:hypothetical protein